METLVPGLRRGRFQSLLTSLSIICFYIWNLGRGIYHLSSEFILGNPIIFFVVELPLSDIRRSVWLGFSCACSGLWVEAQHDVWEVGLAAQLT